MRRNPSNATPGLLTVAGLWLAAASGACTAVYPELLTPVRPVPPGAKLDPEPPSDLVYLTLESADIPERTRDGRTWDRVGGAAPDPFVIVFVDDKELFRTPIEPDTLKPTWPGQKRRNYTIDPEAEVRVELWDANTIASRPICVQRIRNLPRRLDDEPRVIVCGSGARIRLLAAPARARWGIGMYYELRTEQVHVSRVIRESPAARAELARGDRILEIQGKDVKALSADELRTLVNMNARGGLELRVRSIDGRERKLTLKDGPMYPAADEAVPVE